MRQVKKMFNFITEIFKPFNLGDIGLKEKDLYPPYGKMGLRGKVELRKDI